MPLAFPSVSHGTIAFGFFQIEIDMLLLEQLFFFADDFCRSVSDLAGGQPEARLDGHRIAASEKIGNLHGAIAGVDLEGFIGATYRRFPFPETSEGFRQNPEGHRNRAWAADLIAQYGRPETIPVRQDPDAGVTIGEYAFDRDGFGALIAYVDRGGYPRWRDEVRPAYVTEMKKVLSKRRGSPGSPGDTI